MNLRKNTEKVITKQTEPTDALPAELKNVESSEFVQAIDLASGKDESVLVFRALKPLSKKEHEQLSDKIRYEAENTGLRVVLMPYSCVLGDDASAE